MKILQIIYNLAPGGAERFVVDFANELAQQGHDVTLVVLRDDKQGNFGFYRQDISEKTKYLNLNIPLGFRLSNILVFYKLIKELKPQIVHCHLNLVNYFFPLTFLFSRVKFFYTIHSFPNSEVKSSIEYWIRRYFFSNNRMKAVTISDEVTQRYLTYYKTAPYGEIYNGRAIPKPTPEYSEVRNEIQNYRNMGDSVFLHIGTCNKAKNQRMLINVFNRIVSDGDHAVLIIIGSGFESEEGRILKKMACDKIVFLGEKHNVSDYLLNADVFCLSSVREGMPISILEALACGCVPICTPVGGLINTIEDGKTGYLSKSVSEDDYYLSVRSYLENREQIKKSDLIEYYKRRFSIEECVRKYVSFYQANEFKLNPQIVPVDVKQ